MWERVQRFDSQTSVSDVDRFQEVYSEDEEDLRAGVMAMLDPKKRSVSDELYFTDGRSRYPVSRNRSYEGLAYGDRYDSSEDEEEVDHHSRPRSTQVVLRNQEHLARKALERIQRARAKGQPNVTLSHEELEALDQRRDSVSDSAEGKRDSPTKDSPPRSTSTGAWTRRRAKSSATGPAGAPPKRSSGAAPTRRRKVSPDDSPAAYSSGAAPPPAFMLPGPGGAPVYSPLGYYDAAPAAAPSSRSASSRRGPPPATYDTRYGPPRAFVPAQPPYDSDAGRAARRRAAAPAHAAAAPLPYPLYAADLAWYGAPLPPGDPRRVVSGPAGAAYGRVPLRRPVAVRVGSGEYGRAREPRRRASSEEEEDEGVEGEEEGEEEDDVSADELAEVEYERERERARAKTVRPRERDRARDTERRPRRR